ncbi:MAG TPA: hypothetical protein VKT29_05250 [Terriglobales bacterium]|nr:hypothetical protein [Terriglobales bacterium]
MARKSRVLTDHDEIRRWAEERDAQPACVRGTGSEEDVGMIRLDFPGYSGETSLEPIEWDEWLQKFDENNLALLVEDETAQGEQSNFNKIIGRETAAARSQGRKTSRRAERASGGKETRASGRRSAGGNRRSEGARSTAKRRTSARASGSRSGRSTAARKNSSRTGSSRSSSARATTGKKRAQSTRGSSRSRSRRRAA